ncbi:MAG: hypothetical protein KME27_08820 [Lyngbya sp. HA4199-MV5]|jgi:hypothetical protein|nr:hypothetical protein [Lyngbya sp. HA4199-MV5]
MLEIECIQPDDMDVQFAARVLQDLAARFDLEPFLFTRHIRLDPSLGRGGVSHPTLSLGVMHAREPDRFLSVFLHEQMHWFLCACDLSAVDAAIEEFRLGWMNAPDSSRRDEVGADEYSTYLHFAVNWLELDALSTLLGVDRDRDVLSSHSFYRWINACILRDTDKIAHVMSRHGLLRQDARLLR